jgi:hypothetical protein
MKIREESFKELLTKSLKVIYPPLTLVMLPL